MESTDEKAKENAWKEDDNKRSIRAFCDNTSLHGARFLNDKNIVVRLFWFLVLVSAFGICGYQVYWTIYEYNLSPFTTTITREKARTIEFPAVTICNLNSISKRQYVKAAKAGGTNQTDQELEMEIQSAMATMQFQGSENTSAEMHLEQRLNNSESYHQRGGWMASILESYSHKIEDMLSLDWLGPCLWRGVKCSADNFTSLISLKIGQCFTFNSGKYGHPGLNSTIPGPTNGLRLRLNVEESDHVSNSQSLISGFKVSIQPRDEYPLVEEFGFALQPGTHTFVALRERKIKNLPKPYRTNCSSPDLSFAKTYNSSYSVFACMGQCFTEYVVEVCHCQPLFKTISSRIEVCSMKETFECIFPKLFGRLSEKVAECSYNCPEPCNYSKYEVKLSYASAIANSFTRNLEALILSKTDEEKLQPFINMSVKERQEYLSNNVVSLDVYFEEIGYDLVEQQPAITSTTLLGTIGGYLGLFLGMSVLTMLEFVDLLLLWVFKSLRNKTTRVDITSSTH
ncbi:hypothetical protein QZH41_014750 [Actinostola sp. cb2023]|nr:hypothetical protein QZH41_014750 [Actinostola sp. cb2023]